MRALVVCTGGGIGDVLLATPLMRALRSRYDEVAALTSVRNRAVLAGNADLAHLWVSDASLGADVARVMPYRFDACVVTWATARTAALPALARIPVRVGQARRLYSPLFTRRVVVRGERGDRTSHWTQSLLDFARALDCDTDDAMPAFVVPDDAHENVSRLLDACGVTKPYVVIHPTRGISELHRRWPTERFVALARAFGARGYGVVVTGTAGDRAIAEAIAERSGAVSLAVRTSLAEFGALAEASAGVMAMDSGPMHVAAAVGVKTVGIFALQSDEPDRWAPLGPHVAVVRATYPCPPDHRKETCPNFACVANIDVGRVLMKFDALDRTAGDARPLTTERDDP